MAFCLFPSVLCFATTFYTINKSCKFTQQRCCWKWLFSNEVILKKKKNKPLTTTFLCQDGKYRCLAAVSELSLTLHLWADLLSRSSQLGLRFALADSLCKTSQTWPFLSICSAKSVTTQATSYCNIFFLVLILLLLFLFASWPREGKCCPDDISSEQCCR